MAQIRGKGEGTWKRRGNGLWEWQRRSAASADRSTDRPRRRCAELKRLREEESRGVVTDRTLLSNGLDHWRTTVVPTKSVRG
jgi:hypothetical protein